MRGMPDQLEAGVMTPEPANLAAHWAASCHPDPRQVWREWDEVHGVALLPCGRLWDAVTLPYRRMQAIAQDQDGRGLFKNAAILADLEVGRCYLFTATGTAATWAVPGTEVLGEGSWLLASRPGDRRQYKAGTWVQEAGIRDPLVDAARLRAALLRAAEATP